MLTFEGSCSRLWPFGVIELPQGTCCLRLANAHGCAAVHTGLCAFQSVRWHSREQYHTTWHREHTLLASSDAHPAEAHPARATHSALSDSSFPSSSETAYRLVRASKDTTRARLPLCSGLAMSRCTSTRVPAGSGRATPAAANAAALVGGVARMRARSSSKLPAAPSVVG